MKESVMLHLRSRSGARRFIVVAFFALVMVSVAGLTAIINPFAAKKAFAATVSTCSTTGTISTNNNAYIVQNNFWNTAATGTQCVSADNSTGAFTVTTIPNAVATNGAPASYPSIYKGCHWGLCTTNSNLPIQVGSLGSVNSSWNVSLGSSGSFDIAYDIWINQTSTTSGQPNGTEIMIWINHQGAPQPFGSQTATASINGASWNVWTGNQSSWKIISYEAQNPTTSVNFDLNNFIKDAVSRGSANNSWYLIDVEAGTEIWSGNLNFASNSFSVSPTSSNGNPTPTPTALPRTPTTTPPTATPVPPTSTPGSGASCKVAYAVQSQWTGGFTTSVTLTNTGSQSINGWTLGFAFPNSSQKLTSGWNATWSQSGQNVTAASLNYNGALAPGASTSIGFQGTFSSSNPNPTSFTLNGATCTNG
jgi:Glycosyl hydrolase family 12/Cellulose binding domain